ncbi:hypothetical protein BJX66DRAFT_17710 [Aspergillus keveii]|uniref:Uncharacterized protein n=1 Tax=Aspergillus keveii TaxID=714993 RepID=A0ABR4FV91_9EURO
MRVNDDVILESSCPSHCLYTTVHPPKQAQLANPEPQFNNREYFEASTMGSTQAELIIRARNSQPPYFGDCLRSHSSRENHHPQPGGPRDGAWHGIQNPSAGLCFCAGESFPACQCSKGHLFKMAIVGRPEWTCFSRSFLNLETTGLFAVLLPFLPLH